MRLTVKERLGFVELFPQRSDEMTQVLVRDINAKVRLSQKEMEQINLTREEVGEGARLNWNEKKEMEVDITFTSIELKFLKDQRERCDNEKIITQSMLSICLKIREEGIVEPTEVN